MAKKISLEVTDTNLISDGYHTFGELYEHRCLLYVNLCLAQPERAAWKKDYAEWFCLYLETPQGQISYHVPDKFLPLVKDRIKRDDSYAWDGHSSDAVLARLKTWAEKFDPTAPS